MTTPPQPFIFGEMILPHDSIDLSLYTPQELRALKRRIEETLPVEDLDSIDLTKEFLSNYRTAQDMLEDANDDAPLNQQAQVANTLTSILKQLAELQRSHFSAARLQRFEKAAAEVFLQHPGLYNAYKEKLAS